MAEIKNNISKSCYKELIKIIIQWKTFANRSIATIFKQFFTKQKCETFVNSSIATIFKPFFTKHNDIAIL